MRRLTTGIRSEKCVVGDFVVVRSGIHFQNSEVSSILKICSDK
jgi:hypothetical protein